MSEGTIFPREKCPGDIIKGDNIYYRTGPGNGSGNSGVIVPTPGLFDLSGPCNMFL